MVAVEIAAAPCSSPPRTPTAPNRMPERPHLARLGGVDRGKREAGQRLVEKRLEFLAAHGVGKLQRWIPASAAAAPSPCLELA